MILSAMQFTMLRPQDVQASVYKEKAEQIKPIEVTPVAPVKPKFLQIVKTDDEVRYNKQDLFCMAKNIYHEAGSEPTLGKYAVAQVTINRMKSPKYKDTVCSVVFEPINFLGQTIMVVAGQLLEAKAGLKLSVLLVMF